MEKTILKLKEEIIDVLKLDDLTPDDIDPKAPLFKGGLGLDSIDALEIIVLLEKNYGIKMENAQESKEIFTSVENIARYVIEKRQK